MKRMLAYGCFLTLALMLFGCDGGDSTTTIIITATPTATPVPTATSVPTTAETKPTFDWGYPEYSKYVDGKHVGKTLYQTDPTCQTRLTFYTCDFVDAETPDNPQTNPTMASSEMTGGMDSCTAAISEEAPSYCIPADVCNPRKQRNAWAPGQASADNLGWQLFIALNWPGDANQPGYPDTTKKLGDKAPSGGVHAESVWLQYPTLEQLFGVPLPCEGPTLTMDSKVSDNFVSKELNLGAIEGLGGTQEAGGGILVDQNKNVVFFDVRVNRTEWEFIVNQNDYWMTGASLDGIKPNLARNYSDPPGQTPGEFPAALVAADAAPGDVGSSEIKSSWKQLTQAEVDSGTYYTRRFNLFDPDKPPGQQCRSQLMGLVGLHINYQPALFGNPEWVWATFEHRLNTPTAGINDGETQFSFYNPNCPMTKTPAECAAYDAKTDSPEDFKCCPNLELYPNQPAGPLVPVQVTRLTNPTQSTILPTDCTGHYQNAISTYFGEDNVFKNYFLVSTQWPLRGSSTNFPFYDPGITANFPCTQRNSTMETYAVDTSPPTMLNGCSANTKNPFCRLCNGDCVETEAASTVACPGGQEPLNPTQFETADCMGCHGMYAGQNSSFIFSHRPCCTRKDGDLPNTCGDFLKKDVCAANTTCEWATTDPTCKN